MTLEDETIIMSEDLWQLITILFGKCWQLWDHYIVLKCWGPTTIVGHLNIEDETPMLS